MNTPRILQLTDPKDRQILLSPSQLVNMSLDKDLIRKTLHGAKEALLDAVGPDHHKAASMAGAQIGIPYDICVMQYKPDPEKPNVIRAFVKPEVQIDPNAKIEQDWMGSFSLLELIRTRIERPNKIAVTAWMMDIAPDATLDDIDLEKLKHDTIELSGFSAHSLLHVTDLGEGICVLDHIPERRA